VGNVEFIIAFPRQSDRSTSSWSETASGIGYEGVAGFGWGLTAIEH
jgi:hypothetical protein